MHRQPTRHANGSSMLSNLSLTALFFLSLLWHTQVQANYLTSQIPYGLSFPSGTFQVGDVVSIGVWAGNSSQALDHVAGFKLVYNLTQHASLPSSPSINFNNSWVSGGQSFPGNIVFDSLTQKMTLSALDLGTSISGYGEIARFSLICKTNGVSAQQMLAGFGGGIIIQIDDLGTRFGRNIHEDVNASFSVYPNPSQGKIIIQDEISHMSHWILRDLYGKELSRGDQLRINLQRLNLSPGTYFLRIWTHDGKYVSKKLSYSPH